MISRAPDGAALHIQSLLLETIIGPQRWAHVLRALAGEVGSTAAQLSLFRRSDGALLATFASGLSAAAKRAYLAHASQLDDDPRLRALSRRPGAAQACHKLVSDAALQQSRFYRGFLEPSGVRYSLLATDLVDEDKILAVISVGRPASQSPYEERELRRMRALTSQLFKVVEIAAAINRGAHERALLRDLFDRLVIAAFIVDERGQIYYENAAATKLIADCPELRRGEAAASGTPSARLCAELSRSIPGVLRPGAGQASRHQLLRRASGEPPLHVVFDVLPLSLSPGIGWSAPTPRLAVFLIDSRKTYVIDEQLLQSSFGLTLAEANVLRLLAEGVPIGRVATARGSTIGTVRTQISTIMSKTGTHRQADLIRLALTASPLFRDNLESAD